jgi:hypothetical protein
VPDLRVVCRRSRLVWLPLLTVASMIVSTATASASVNVAVQPFAALAPSHVPAGVIASPFSTLASNSTSSLSPSVAANTITCNINRQNPHKSTHVPGTINFVITISCDGTVSDFQGQAVLYFNGNEVANTGGVNQGGGTSKQINVASNCRVGRWQAGAATGLRSRPAIRLNMSHSTAGAIRST